MRSTIIGQGRHRLGRPGLVPVRQFVAVHQQNLLVRMLGWGRRHGRHHDLRVVDPASVRTADHVLSTVTA